MSERPDHRTRRFDAVVVGSGPAGSTAALVLARAGARVAVVEKARMPRDKACGDLIGQRGVQALDDLGIALPHARRLEGMVVLGPTGREVRLPTPAGATYPGHALVLPRTTFDECLQHAAVGAGAELVGARVASADDDGVVLDGGERLEADAVIGADGALSVVAASAGLLDAPRLLWGFAVRAYVEAPVELPVVSLWDTSPRRAFPGYGWVFPGVDGSANVGLGIGTGSDRAAGARATRQLDAFLAHLQALGRLPDGATTRRMGGWLKMGMVGTRPARGRVLLVGDAAGLVNPLQGEGIAQALDSGRAAAEAVLAGPDLAAGRYLAHLRARHGRFLGPAASVHALLMPRPRMTSAIGRALTSPGLGSAVSGAWSLSWADLLDGAVPGPSRRLARVADVLGRVVTAPSPTSRWLGLALADRS